MERYTSKCLLAQLMSKGICPYIEAGRLIIPSEGMTADHADFINKRQKIILEQILDLTGAQCMRFSDHVTRKYKGGNNDTLALRFTCIQTGALISAYYNACVTYRRATKNKKKGDTLPNKNFSVGSRSTYAQFWKSIDLPLPRYESEYRDMLHHLKPLLFCSDSEVKENDRRVENKIIPLLSISQNEILKAKSNRDKIGLGLGKHR